MPVEELLEPLMEPQQAVIDLVGRPWHVNSLEDTKGWPTWDFVQRRYKLNHSGYPPVEEVVESLPSVSVSNRAYGLMWTEQPAAGLIRPNDRVGLTIAGLRHLGPPDAVNTPVKLDEICLDILRTVAQLEAEAAEDLDWTVVVSKTFDLRTDHFNNYQGNPVVITGEILCHEFEPLAGRTTQHNYAISYGGGRFQRFQDVHSVEDYLAVVARSVDPRESEVAETSMDVGVALDYLSMTLALDKRWTQHDRLVQLTHVEDAMTVARSPSTRTEFNQCVSSLANILGQLRTVPGSDTAYDSRNWNKSAKGSLNNLEIWLDETFPDGHDCQAALSDLRRILKLRQEAQHRSTGTSSEADKARRELGLSDPITDWPASWEHVTRHAANALAHIARTVRRPSSP